MKGLILLSLMGFIFAMSTRARITGGILPFGGDGTFGTGPAENAQQGSQTTTKNPLVTPQKAPDPGLRTPLENEGGFNKTTNSTTNATTAPVEKTRLELKGTWTPIENDAGFGPPPENEENTQ